MDVNRDEFMVLGTHCSDRMCNQLDFLPFRCQACALPFCQDHWRPTDHSCTKYDAAKADNRIPSCPLCSQPVTFPVGTDPNPAMDRHLSTFCVVLNPDAKPPKTTPGGMPTCHQTRCQTKMVVPIRCTDGCGFEFCAAHRWGRDHACPGKQAGSSSAAGAKAGAGSFKTKMLSGTAAGEKAGLAALRRAQAAMSNGGGAKAKGGAAKGKAELGTPGNPIVINDDDEDDVKIVLPKKKGPSKIGIAGIPVGKMDRRALAERASARKALEARAKKGLLSEAEKQAYAIDRAREAREGNTGDKGCIAS